MSHLACTDFIPRSTYVLKSTPAGSLKRWRLLRTGPDDGSRFGLGRLVKSSRSPITMPLPAGAGGPEGGRTLRSASSMVVVACGSFTLGLELGRDAFPPAPTSSKASLGFSGGGGSTDGRVPGEASGGGGTTTASILGASTGAGIEGTGTGAGCGGRNRGPRGTGAG